MDSYEKMRAFIATRELCSTKYTPGGCLYRIASEDDNVMLLINEPGAGEESHTDREERVREMASSLLLTASSQRLLHHPHCRQVSSELAAAAAAARSPFYGRIVIVGKGTEARRVSASPVVSLFGFGKSKKEVVTKRETVIPDPDYRIPVVLLGIAGGLAYTDNIGPAVPIGILGLFLLFQTTRVRFVFDDEALEVKVGDKLEDAGENAFVGGKNRWKYSSFVNWEFWWPNFPILVYFKENQTKPDGQIHFFPILFNGRQLYDVMVERLGPSETSGPK